VRSIEPGTRLFAITVEGSGGVEIAALRQGAPVTLGRCRVDVNPPCESTPEPSAVPRRGRRPARPGGPGSWRGDVEPIGFPFQLGLLGPIKDGRYDFDNAGEWLLAAGRQHGPLYAWRIDGSAAELLPRTFVDGRVFSWIQGVLGVAGGCVVS